MKIDFFELNNFRKLKCCRIDVDKKQTLLVGANNSGKTTAVIALRKFLLAPKSLELRDISIGNWSEIDAIGSAWEQDKEPQAHLENLLPSLDVWLDVPLIQIHHVVHIIPDVNWAGGAVGVRMRFEIENLDLLKADYLAERTSAKKIEGNAVGEDKPSISRIILLNF
jgi:predicted ATP-dependent endonuclease of OLD family